MMVITEQNMESEVWKEIQVICPICKKKKMIYIPARIINHAKQLTSISIPRYRVCDHAFVPFIDKHFQIRGYQKVDFEVEGETFEQKTEEEQKTELKPQDIDVFEIKINVTPVMITYAIHSCLCNRKVLILIDQELIHLNNIMIDFFKFIFQKSFDINISVKSKSEYKKNKKLYAEEYIILESNNVLGEAKKIIKFNQLKNEEEIVKDFYKEGDSISSIINLRDKIREIYALTKKILEFNERQEGRPIITRTIIRYLENTQFVKINRNYFNFLIEIVKNYYNENIILVKDYIANKIEKMWRK